MRNYRLIFGLLVALVVCALLTIQSKGLKYGIDLSGGTILVYKLKEGTKTTGDTLNDLITALQGRLNPEGVSDLPIRKVGSSKVEIILADASPEEVEILKRKITDVGSLEFRILANPKHDAAAIKRALAPGGLTKPPAGYQWVLLGETISGTGARILDDSRFQDASQTWARNRFKGTEATLTGKDSSGRDLTRTIAIESNTDDTVTLARPHGLNSITRYQFTYNPSQIQAIKPTPEQLADPARGLPSDVPIGRDETTANGRVEHYVLIKLDRQNVTGQNLAHTFPTQDERMQPAVGFAFNASGARKFGSLTGDHLPEEEGAFQYRLAIILDGVVRSAPSIRSRITDQGIIESVQPEEVQYLIEILKSGSLPATLDPVPELEEKIGPTLGKDTIDKGLRAIWISMLVVPIFMVLFYRFAGVVAVLCLALNMLLLVAVMALTDSSFTLPGLAGLALTIGMAVDANVLIFERMREEKERGASMGQQVRNGFDRAWSTIFDSNVTTVLSAAILWAVGTQEVKGFALTLIIGLILNLLTAVWVSRVIFDFFYSKGWLKKLTMMKLLDKTQIDFIGPRRLCITGSLIAIALGLAAFFLRGQDIYNIDFTGGTLVTLRLNPNSPEIQGLSESARADFVRSAVSEVLPGVSVEGLNVGSEAAGLRFNLRTTDANVNDVQKKVLDTFSKVLDVVNVTIGPAQPITGPAPTTTSDTAKSADAAKTDAAKTTAATKPATPFAGGNSYELTFSRPVAPATISALLDRFLTAANVATPQRRYELAVPADTNPRVGATRLTLRTDLEPEVTKTVLDQLVPAVRDDPGLLFDRRENFSAAVAGETRTLAIIAMIASWLVIIAYLWFRFKSFAFGVAAVIALVHDVLIALGAVAITGFVPFMDYKIDLPMVAAFLTLIGFSVNDTIVIFDRIREIRGKTPYLTPEIINAAINQTLSRTILTSLTAWLVVLILYLFGGEGLRGFSFTLVVGFLSGTYSTVYIAAPILIEWLNRERFTPNVKEKVAAEV